MAKFNKTRRSKKQSKPRRKTMKRVMRGGGSCPYGVCIAGRCYAGPASTYVGAC